VNLFSISLKLNFETIPTPGSLRSVISSTCTSGLDRPSSGGDLGNSLEGIGEIFATRSLIGDGGGGNSGDEPEVVRIDEVSDVSLIVVKSFAVRSGMNDSIVLLLLLL